MSRRTLTIPHSTRQRGHVRSKSTGVAASPGMRRSAGKTLAAPVVTDVKAVSKGLVKVSPFSSSGDSSLSILFEAPTHATSTADSQPM